MKPVHTPTITTYKDEYDGNPHPVISIEESTIPPNSIIAVSYTHLDVYKRQHVICGAIVGGGLAYVWQRTWLEIAGTCGLLGACLLYTSRCV